MEEGVLPVGHTIAPDFITTQKVVSPRIDPTRLTKPKLVGDFRLRGSVCAGFIGRFEHTVAQVSASSNTVEFGVL
jgi:hypothetical protein